MKWRNPSPSDADVQLVRPLLDQPKTVLGEYAAECRIRFREDASNALLDFQRNRIRHELLPLLRKKYQPALDRTIARVMDIVGAEGEFVAQVAGEWLRGLGNPMAEIRRPKEVRSPKSEAARASLRRLLRRKGRGQDDLLFEDLPVAVQRRCVQMQLIGQGIEPDFELVERLRCAAGRSVSLGSRIPEPRARTWVGRGIDRGPLSLSLSPSEGERVPSCAGGEKAGGTGGTPVLRYAIRDRWGRIQLQIAAVEGFSFSSAEVDLKGRAGEIEFDGTRVSWRVDSKKGVAQARAGVRQESFDADRVGSPIRLRHWQPGDRFQPIGMACAVKLQDFFTNQKVPRDRRRQLVVAATAQGEVFWLEGARISERFKLTLQTNRRLQWRWKRL